MYDELSIEALRRGGCPDPEATAAAANRVLDLIHQRRFAEAREALSHVAADSVRKDLGSYLECREHWSCIT